MKQQNDSRIEKGKTNFSNKMLYKIQNEFHIKPLDFITKDVEQSNIITANINYTDDYTTRIMFAKLRKQIAEQKVRIAELEIEARRQKVDKVITGNFEPIYVMI
jgi:transcriptional regulator with XRE-family HTH domain